MALGLRSRIAACGAALVLGAAAGCSALLPGSAAAQLPSPTALPAPGGEPDDGEGAAALDACALLPLALAEETIERRVRLQTSSTPGTSECLYVNVDRDQPPYSVDLDLGADGSAEALRNMRTGYSQPNVRIADETGLGAGAFSALNVTSATVVCVGDGVLHEVEVFPPPFPPDVIEANAAFALERVRGLAARYCAPPDVPEGGGGAGVLDACALLPLALAEETIERRVPLQTSSTPGTSECLYVNVDRDQPPYSVDLDVGVAGPETLQDLRTGYSQPNVRIADEAGLGAGAFSALNVTSATVVCVGDQVAHEVEVFAPPFPPDVIEANAAFALERARGLAARYCG